MCNYSEKKLHVKCCVCQKDDSKLYFIEDNHSIVKCRKCGHIYENPLNVQDVHFKYHLTKNWLAENNFTKIEFSKHPRFHIYDFALKTMRKHNLMSGKILEIGCSRGHFLKYMNENNYRCYGIEPGQDAREAIACSGGKIFNGFVEDFQTDEKFQGIFLLDVLEHIPNPHKIIAQAFKWLATDGIIIVMVPNLWIQRIRILFARCGLKPFGIILSAGNHINHFSPTTLKTIFLQQPFREVKIVNSPIDLQYIRGLPKFWAPAKKAYWKIANLIQRITNIPAAGNITAIATK